MSKFCEKCGKPINEGAVFCGSCGNPVRTTTESVTDITYASKEEQEAALKAVALEVKAGAFKEKKKPIVFLITYASKEEREAALAAVANDVKNGKYKKKKNPLAIIIPIVAVIVIIGIIFAIVSANNSNALVITNNEGHKVFRYNLEEFVTNMNGNNSVVLKKNYPVSDFFMDDTNAFGNDETSPKSYYGYFDSKSNLFRVFTDSDGHIEHLEYVVLGSSSDTVPDEVAFMLRAFYDDIGFNDAVEIVDENKNQLTSLDISGAEIYEEEENMTFSEGLKEARSISVRGAGDSSLIAPLKSYKDVIISYGTSNNYQVWYITVA